MLESRFLTFSAVLVGLRVGSVGGLGLIVVSMYTWAKTGTKAHPIHCSAGGSPMGLTADSGDSRKCFNSSGVYLIAMIAGTT
jgi:hypothetical protein